MYVSFNFFQQCFLFFSGPLLNLCPSLAQLLQSWWVKMWEGVEGTVPMSPPGERLALHWDDPFWVLGSYQRAFMLKCWAQLLVTVCLMLSHSGPPTASQFLNAEMGYLSGSLFQESIFCLGQPWSSSPNAPEVWSPVTIFPWNFSCQEQQGAFSRNVIGREDKHHANYIPKPFPNHIKVLYKESSGLTGVW